MRKLRVFFVAASIVCFSVAGLFYYKGYDVKNKYYYSEVFTDLNKNAYVGGDAYNYMINGSYFTGYSIIASAALLGGMIFVSDAVGITIKLKDEEDENS
jgi:hypothetical protein